MRKTELSCPHCKEEADADDPGDLKMCAECGLWSRRDGNELRRLTRNELREVAGAFAEFLRFKRDFLT
jgi:hypothetical protein